MNGCDVVPGKCANIHNLYFIKTGTLRRFLPHGHTLLKVVGDNNFKAEWYHHILCLFSLIFVCYTIPSIRKVYCADKSRGPCGQKLTKLFFWPTVNAGHSLLCIAAVVLNSSHHHFPVDKIFYCNSGTRSSTCCSPRRPINIPPVFWW